MKGNIKKSSKKMISSAAITKRNNMQAKILEYCGYKLEGKKLVMTGSYNPVPYQGL